MDNCKQAPHRSKHPPSSPASSQVMSHPSRLPDYPTPPSPPRSPTQDPR